MQIPSGSSRPALRGWRSAFALAALISVVLHAQELTVTPVKLPGVYQPGETIQWTVEVKGAETTQASYVLKSGGVKEVGKGKLDLSAGKGVLAAKLDEPGWLLAEITIPNSPGNGVIKTLGGALVAPEKITRAEPRPEDFDAFWSAKLKELAAVPANPQLTAAEGGKPGVAYFKVQMDNLRGTRIQGQLARPQKEGKFPALLIVQWAGVYPLQKGWATERAAEGWLVLNLLAHDLPIDNPESFYQEQAGGALKDYVAIGNDDRETSYFLRMYLSCFRGAEYLAGRPDWDGRTLVVTGGSQGGLQSLVTAAIHPKITAVLASVPAGCDVNGPVAGRLPGWPMWYHQTQGKNAEKVRATGRYFDVVNFAPRVTCPVLIGAGLIDTVCPPPGVFAAFNELKGPKEMVVMPVAEHGDKKGSHAPYYDRFNAWKAALVKGEPAPVRNK
jgi:cephalosporin-C deacetylase-like acetyl esterase